MKRALLLPFLLPLTAALLSAETRILLNKTSASSELDVQQITVPQGERVVVSVPVLSGNVWFKNAEPVPGASGRVLILEAASSRDSGRYRVGYVGDSSSATQELLLTVAPPPGGSAGGRLHTFTTRGIAGPGADSLVVGFAIGDTAGQPSATRRVLIRAIGPTLADFGVSNFVRQPQLAVYDDASGNRIQNQNTDPVALARATLSTGAFPLRPGAGDVAVLVTLPAGSYTAQISPGNGLSGVVMLDVHEVPAE